MADSSSSGRNFILAGVALGLGAAAAGFYVSSSFDSKRIDHQQMGDSNVPAMAQKVKTAYDEAVRDVVVADVAPQDAWIPCDKVLGTDGKLVKNPEGKLPRYTPIFFAPKLWLVAEGQEKAVVRDLLTPEDPEKPSPDARLHKDVPNDFFFRYGLDEVICDSNAPEQDSDGDGFTNAEEHEGGTDPSDSANHPPFVVGSSAKMVWVKRHVSNHWLELSNMSDPSGASVVINSYQTKDLAYAGRYQAKDLKVGDTFGLEAGDGKGALDKNRFKVVAIHTGGADGSSVVLEDNYTKVDSAKNITVFAGRNKVAKVDDISVDFRMTAGSSKGKELGHAVQVGESFNIPGFANTSATLISATKSDVKIRVGDKEVKIEREEPAPKEKK